MRNRAADSAELVPELHAALAARTALEWEEISGERVSGAAVRRIEDMFDHPPVLAEDLVTRLDHPVVGHYRTMTKPVKFSDTPGAVAHRLADIRPTQRRGSRRACYSAADIASLRERDIVR
jgi:crotonobetainyl-CoA:carnitine CoA-transferase CaiB-like acyl-CoA transferase